MQSIQPMQNQGTKYKKKKKDKKKDKKLKKSTPSIFDLYSDDDGGTKTMRDNTISIKSSENKTLSQLLEKTMKDFKGLSVVGGSNTKDGMTKSEMITAKTSNILTLENRSKILTALDEINKYIKIYDKLTLSQQELLQRSNFFNNIDNKDLLTNINMLMNDETQNAALNYFEKLRERIKQNIKTINRVRQNQKERKTIIANKLQVLQMNFDLFNKSRHKMIEALKRSNQIDMNTIRELIAFDDTWGFNYLGIKLSSFTNAMLLEQKTPLGLYNLQQIISNLITVCLQSCLLKSVKDVYSIKNDANGDQLLNIFTKGPFNDIQKYMDGKNKDHCENPIMSVIIKGNSYTKTSDNSLVDIYQNSKGYYFFGYTEFFDPNKLKYMKFFEYAGDCSEAKKNNNNINIDEVMDKVSSFIDFYEKAKDFKLHPLCIYVRYACNELMQNIYTSNTERMRVVEKITPTFKNTLQQEISSLKNIKASFNKTRDMIGNGKVVSKTSAWFPASIITGTKSQFKMLRTPKIAKNLEERNPKAMRFDNFISHWLAFMEIFEFIEILHTNLIPLLMNQHNNPTFFGPSSTWSLWRRELMIGFWNVLNTAGEDLEKWANWLIMYQKLLYGLLHVYFKKIYLFSQKKVQNFTKEELDDYYSKTLQNINFLNLSYQPEGGIIINGRKIIEHVIGAMMQLNTAYDSRTTGGKVRIDMKDDNPLANEDYILEEDLAEDQYEPSDFAGTDLSNAVF